MTIQSIHFTSLGCARNLVDTEVMLGLVQNSGYTITPTIENADYLVVNTCGFLEAARQEAYEVLDEIFAEKQDSAKVIVTGCLAQRDPIGLKKEFKDLHAILGSGDVKDILSAITSKKSMENVSELKSYLQEGEVPRLLSTPPHYAFLKIAEGCLKRCSFCIIPHIKGNLRSKDIQQVKNEFQALLLKGVQEIILIAQDLGDFGKDTTKRTSQLVPLLKELLSFEGDFWLRLLYLYPDEIDGELLQLFKEDSRLCPYVDMPIQHVSNRILRRMRRKTNEEFIRKKVAQIKKEVPHMVIRTSLMVGFPGETEEDFQKLVDFVKEGHLDHVGVFAYSREKESASYHLPDQVSEDVKEERRQILSEEIAKQSEEIHKRWVGKTLPVLVDDYHRDSNLLLSGHFQGQCPQVDGEVIINNPAMVQAFGEKVQVEIQEVLGYDLVGHVVLSEKEKKAKNKLATLSA